jgi:putative addiction module antidote
MSRKQLRSRKTTGAHRNDKSKRKSGGVTTKDKIFELWLKSPDLRNLSEWAEQFRGEVKTNTIRIWVSGWNRGAGFPRSANGREEEIKVARMKADAIRKMITVKLTTVGSSTGIVLPRELLDQMRVSKGDLLHVVETPNGVELTPYNPEFAAQLAVAEEVMRADRDVLKQLAN